MRQCDFVWPTQSPSKGNAQRRELRQHVAMGKLEGNVLKAETTLWLMYLRNKNLVLLKRKEWGKEWPEMRSGKAARGQITQGVEGSVRLGFYSEWGGKPLKGVPIGWDIITSALRSFCCMWNELKWPESRRKKIRKLWRASTLLFPCFMAINTHHTS